MSTLSLLLLLLLLYFGFGGVLNIYYTQNTIGFVWLERDNKKEPYKPQHYRLITT